tara:strand:- start:419 stop:1195 length:777 start_codon:yes stop_codon:yes gene_type:complete
MKIFILCGGFGSRLDHEGVIKAKPMIKIGKKPMISHIIENFIDQGFTEFVLCLGYKHNSIRDFFLIENKKNIQSIKISNNLTSIKIKNKNVIFKIDLINTGLNSGTGGRIMKAYNKLKLSEDIIMTYGDGLSDVPIKKLIKFHYNNKSEVTLTAVRPKERYGVLTIKNKKVTYFDNENKKSNVYINGGFFIISKNALKEIKDKDTYWEKEPLIHLKNKKKLFAYKHEGFWKSLDTLKDKNEFNKLFKENKNLWKVKKR